VVGAPVSASKARRLAVKVVTRVREREAYAHETLDAVLSAAKPDQRDAAFATRLAYGTVACRGTLDEAIARFVSAPASLEPLVADALAVSAYEILFARTPARAAVSEGVELVRAVQPRAAGLANAVLRRLAEAADAFPWGDVSTDTSALARSLGHPAWLAELWVGELGRETATRVMQADNEPAPLYLAHMPFAGPLDVAIDRLAQDGAEPAVCELPGCVTAGIASAAIRSEALRQRLFIVADAGAQYAAYVMAPLPGTSIVEIGAGRGTKTLIMAGIAREAGGEVSITAIDTHRFKLDALTQAAQALGVAGITTAVADATEPRDETLPGPQSADSVLVDAPCSGLGTLRRHPDRRWRARPQEIEALAALGARLLESAAALVKPGGFVVYSTCTIARRENAQVVEAFLASEAGRGFGVVPLDAQTPASWTRFVTPEGFFQSLPESGGMDGHFVARLERTE